MEEKPTNTYRIDATGVDWAGQPTKTSFVMKGKVKPSQVKTREIAKKFMSAKELANFSIFKVN